VAGAGEGAIESEQATLGGVDDLDGETGAGGAGGSAVEEDGLDAREESVEAGVGQAIEGAVEAETHRVTFFLAAMADVWTRLGTAAWPGGMIVSAAAAHRGWGQERAPVERRSQQRAVVTRRWGGRGAAPPRAGNAPKAGETPTRDGSWIYRGSSCLWAKAAI